MKNLLIILSFIIIASYSCSKKKNIVPSPAISATINGKDEVFEVKDSVKINRDTVYMTGTNKASGDKIVLWATHFNNALVIGEYNDTISTNPIPVWAYMIYYPSAQLDTSYLSFYFLGSMNFPCIINISQLSNNNIQGTFNGRLIFANGPEVSNDTSASKKKIITNGKINITY